METILITSTVLNVIMLIIISFMFVKIKVLKTTANQLDLKRRKNANALTSNKELIETQGSQIKELQELLLIEQKNTSALRSLLNRSNKKIAKGVVAVNKNGYEIAHFDSIKKASEKLGISRSAIRRSALFFKDTKKGKIIKSKNYYIKFR